MSNTSNFMYAYIVYMLKMQILIHSEDVRDFCSIYYSNTKSRQANSRRGRVTQDVRFQNNADWILICSDLAASALKSGVLQFLQTVCYYYPKYTTLLIAVQISSFLELQLYAIMVSREFTDFYFIIILLRKKYFYISIFPCNDRGDYSIHYIP